MRPASGLSYAVVASNSAVSSTPFTIKLASAGAHPRCPSWRLHAGIHMTMHREVAMRVSRLMSGSARARLAVGRRYRLPGRAYQLGIPINMFPADCPPVSRSKYASRDQRLHETDLGAEDFANPAEARGAAPFCWTASQPAETVRRLPFDPDVSLSHWPIVLMNVLGAVEFARLAITNRPKQPEADQIKQTTRSLR